MLIYHNFKTIDEIEFDVIVKKNERPGEKNKIDRDRTDVTCLCGGGDKNY